MYQVSDDINEYFFKFLFIVVPNTLQSVRLFAIILRHTLTTKVFFTTLPLYPLRSYYKSQSFPKSL